MTQFYSRNDVNYSGDVYSIPFKYIHKKEVKVYIDDELWTKWHFLNTNQLTLDEVPEGIGYNNIVSVRRETDIEEKVVTYDNNSLLNKENLNKSQDQLLYAVQEIYDNNTQFAIDIRAEVDEKVERVSDAVEKLDIIDASVETAVQKAQEATEQAQEVIQQKEDFLAVGEKLLVDITAEADRAAEHVENIDEVIANMNTRVSFAMFDTVLKDHILTYEESKGLALQGTYVYKTAVAGSRYGYPDFYAKCLEEYNQATQTETVNGVQIKVHPNGHKFYDIVNKTVIDEFFNTMGSAWFYGIDIENERVFLPRNNYFEQTTGNISEVGLSVEAGLPNIEGELISNLAGGTAIPSSGTGALKSSTEAVAATKTGSGGFGSVAYHDLIFNASDSNTIYGNSNTVQPNAVKKLLYICVGNTVSQSTVTNVIDVTTTENDTVPLFTGQYFDFKPNNLSWLKGGEQKNSGGVYTFCYNELVNELTNPKYGLKVINESDMIAGIDYSLYWKVNQTEMTFRLPLLDGSEKAVEVDYSNPTVYNVTSSGIEFIVEKDGVIVPDVVGQSVITLKINGNIVESNKSGGSASLVYMSGSFQVKKGDVVEVNATYQTVNHNIRFFPYINKGNGSLYFKVANAVQNLELLDVGRIEETLATKLDRGNKQEIIDWMLPDYTAGITGEVTVSNNVKTLTAPNDGWIFYHLMSHNTGISYLKINDITIVQVKAAGNPDTSAMEGLLKVAKGDVITYCSSYSNTSYSSQTVVFYPMKGAN